MANDRLRFWQEKLDENQHILEMLNSGQFKSSDGGELDEKILVEVRKWATGRVAECQARIAACTHRDGARGAIPWHAPTAILQGGLGGWPSRKRGKRYG